MKIKVQLEEVIDRINNDIEHYETYGDTYEAEILKEYATYLMKIYNNNFNTLKQELCDEDQSTKENPSTEVEENSKIKENQHETL